MPKAPTEPCKTLSDAPLKVQQLLDIVATLRGPDGCPWDKEQTHLSLTQYAIEECFEMVDAIESLDDSKIKEELGDVLFQVVLHAQLASERGAFDFNDLVMSLSEKMLRRHPHVFADTKVSGTADVKKNWEDIKRAEKKSQNLSQDQNILNVPLGLPALQRAYKIGKRTEKLQFDCDNP
jgi:tetrapyrrole methylase family protein/MazG family protein